MYTTPYLNPLLWGEEVIREWLLGAGITGDKKVTQAPLRLWTVVGGGLVINRAAWDEINGRVFMENKI